MRLTHNALAWLQDLLSIRLGVDLALTAVEGGYLLTLKANPHRGVLFRSQGEEGFRVGQGDLPCATWSADEEGWRTPLGLPLPMPGRGRSPAGRLIDIQQSIVNFDYDLPGLLWWVLTRAEEIEHANYDVHGRFSVESSHAFRHGYLDRPIVDEWIGVLRQLLDFLWGDVCRVEERYSFSVTHDVDYPSKYKFASPLVAFRRVLSATLRDRRYGEIQSYWRSRFSSDLRIDVADPYNQFDWMMNLSEKFNAKGVYYFICGRTHSSRDTDYQVKDPAIRALMKNIHARGHEIGLHPSYNTFLSSDSIQQEAAELRRVMAEEKIDQSYIGGRMHYLRWRAPETVRSLEKAGLAYDATLNYAAQPGFRAGTCHQYQMFDAVEDRKLEIQTRPLILMDVSLTDGAYLGLSVGGNESLQLFEKLRDRCMAVKGCFTMLWHNTHCINPELRSFYATLFSRGVYEY